MCDDEIWQIFRFNEIPQIPIDPEVNIAAMSEDEYALYRRQQVQYIHVYLTAQMEKLLALYREQFARLRDVLSIKHRVRNAIRLCTAGIPEIEEEEGGCNSQRREHG